MKRRPYKKASLVDRLNRRTAYVGDCWLWTGSVANTGYGQITSGGTTLLVHRVAYEQLVGPIPEGMNVLHRCDTARCWNPAHLFLGTHADNVADKVSKVRQRLFAKLATVKLDEADVPLACVLHEAGHSWRSLAKLFKVSHDIVRVRCGRSTCP